MEPRSGDGGLQGLLSVPVVALPLTNFVHLQEKIVSWNLWGRGVEQPLVVGQAFADDFNKVGRKQSDRHLLRPIPLASIGDYKRVVCVLFINVCNIWISELALDFPSLLRFPLVEDWRFPLSIRRRLLGLNRQLRLGTHGLGVGMVSKLGILQALGPQLGFRQLLCCVPGI